MRNTCADHRDGTPLESWVQGAWTKPTPGHSAGPATAQEASREAGTESCRQVAPWQKKVDAKERERERGRRNEARG